MLSEDDEALCSLILKQSETGSNTLKERKNEAMELLKKDYRGLFEN